MVLPTAVKLSYSLFRFLVDNSTHSREVDDEDDEIELEVEGSLI